MIVELCLVCREAFAKMHTRHILCGLPECKRAHVRSRTRQRAAEAREETVRMCRCGTVIPAVGNRLHCSEGCQAASRREAQQRGARKRHRRKADATTCICGATIAQVPGGGRARVYCSGRCRREAGKIGATSGR